jgi:hypothetical protein
MVHAEESDMSELPPGSEQPYQLDEEWSRAVFGRRTGEVAAFLVPHLRVGMRLIDCGSDHRMG